MTYNPTAGTSITSAAQDVLHTLRVMPELPPIDLRFNDITLRVTRDDTVEGIVALYNAEHSRLAAIRRASPEGQAAIAARIKEIDEILGKFNSLMDSLPRVDDLRNAAAWCYAMSQVNDDRCIRDNHPRWFVVAARHFERLGFVANECTKDQLGHEPSTVNEWNRWLVGQAIECLNYGMPIPPLAGEFWMEWMEREDGHAIK